VKVCTATIIFTNSNPNRNPAFSQEEMWRLSQRVEVYSKEP